MDSLSEQYQSVMLQGTAEVLEKIPNLIQEAMRDTVSPVSQDKAFMARGMADAEVPGMVGSRY